MSYSEKLSKHAALVDRMADRLGIDLTEAELRAHLSGDEIVALTQRCTACTDPERCARLLDGTVKLEGAPDFCRNREKFADLANRLGRA